MHTLCRFAVGCPAANVERLGCECAIYMVSDDEIQQQDNETLRSVAFGNLSTIDSTPDARIHDAATSAHEAIKEGEAIER